jgi:hypothetical protein
MATALDKQLDREDAVAAIRSALETHDNHAARQIAAKLDATGVASRVDWGAIAQRADALASALEASLPEARDWADASARLDTATMIRVRAGGPARRGGPFDWRKLGSLWQAKGRQGTDWAVVPYRDGYGIIVASWDWPDWSCTSVEDAKRIAEEIDARPDFPKRLGIVEHLLDD